MGTYHVQFELPPGSYIMRTVVREPGGLIGSADRRMEVRAFSGPDVTVSDLVLGSATGSLPVRAAAFAEDGLSGMVETYGRAPDQLRALAVTASLVPAGGNDPAATTEAIAHRYAACRRRRQPAASFALPLKDIAPGPYLARVRVTAGSEPVADLTREVDVRAGAVAARRRVGRGRVSPAGCSRWRFRQPRAPGAARREYAGLGSRPEGVRSVREERLRRCRRRN